MLLLILENTFDFLYRPCFEWFFVWACLFGKCEDECKVPLWRKTKKLVSMAGMIFFLPFLLWFSIPFVASWFPVFVRIWRSLEAFDHLLIRGLNSSLPRRYEAWWGCWASVSYVLWRCWCCCGRAFWSVWIHFWSLVLPIPWMVHCMSVLVVQERRWIQTFPMKRNEDDG